LLLYYITDRTAFPGNETQRRARLLEKISEAALTGIDYIQLREKDLSVKELETLARESVQLICESRSKTRLLINSRSDIALAAQANGVHLRSNDISPADARKIWQSAKPIIAVSCHNPEQVTGAQRANADFVVFGPVFEKKVFEKKNAVETIAGIDQLRIVCRTRIPVLALGGVTLQNAGLCIAAGASGIAAIRLFQDNEISTVVEKLRVLGKT
jgi:thiamine-phosphate pyrophosphorylase